MSQPANDDFSQHLVLMKLNLPWRLHSKMLEAHGAEVSTEDANHKFLRSLPPAWSNLAMTMRTKPDVDTLSIDDLYNKLRVLRKELTKECGYIQGENEGRREDSFSKIRSRKEKNRNPELFADLDDGVVTLGENIHS
ncbi:hypothetical protein Tco_1492859 [Tanacetum coccineum]